MVAFLIALAPYLPILLEVVGVIIKMFGTSKENLAAYEAMVQKNKDAGLITVETAERLRDFHQQMLKELEAKEAAKNDKTKTSGVN